MVHNIISELLPLATSKTLAPFVPTLQSSAAISSVPTPEIITTRMLEVPSLIPAASNTAVSSLTTQQRPVMSYLMPEVYTTLH